MELYLIRHTTPNVPKNTIYGWSEVECLQQNFLQEATTIKAKLPSNLNNIFSSDSLRCKQLVTHLFPNKKIEFSSQLRELNFGDWELQTWDNINQHDSQKWMVDFVNEIVPNGESYLQLYERVVGFLQRQEIFKPVNVMVRNSLCLLNGKASHSKLIRPFVPQGDNNTVAIVCHAGVIRSLLCYCNKTNLQDSFINYKVPIACVYKISYAENNVVVKLL